MDRQFDFRLLLLKLQDRLSQCDRQRFHFIFGDLIPANLREDTTLNGTLNLLESLFDQGKINDRHFGYLIQAFNELHHYEAVKRLKEHQQAPRPPEQQSSLSTEIFIDNVQDDKMRSACSRTHTFSSTSETSEFTEPFFLSVKPEPEKINLPERVFYPPPAYYSAQKNDVTKSTFLKRLLKSRLTLSQLILLGLNILAILAFVVIFIAMKKRSCGTEDVLLVTEGPSHGDGDLNAGNAFYDTTELSLKYSDKLTAIDASWSDTELESVAFMYSNNQWTKRRGLLPSSKYKTQFILKPGESINKVTLYIGLRKIDNPYKPNGTFIIVGLRFDTTENRNSSLFGSSDGREVSESYMGYTLAYVQGRALGYIDRLQFVWYKRRPSDSYVALQMH